MQLISDDTLEFEEIESKPESGCVSRKSYRLPLKNKENFLLEFDSNTYPLLDMSIEGVSIEVRAMTPISLGEIKSACKIIFGDKIFAGLVGKVVHTSLDCEGNWICGIHWLNIDEDISNSIEQALLALRKEMFKYA